MPVLCGCRTYVHHLERTWFVVRFVCLVECKLYERDADILVHVWYYHAVLDGICRSRKHNLHCKTFGENANYKGVKSG